MNDENVKNWTTLQFCYTFKLYLWPLFLSHCHLFESLCMCNGSPRSQNFILLNVNWMSLEYILSLIDSKSFEFFIQNFQRHSTLFLIPLFLLNVEWLRFIEVQNVERRPKNDVRTWECNWQKEFITKLPTFDSIIFNLSISLIHMIFFFVCCWHGMARSWFTYTLNTLIT